MTCFRLSESRGRWERDSSVQVRMDFQGRSERRYQSIFEYVRRSMALRNEKSAYIQVRVKWAQSAKQGGTAGLRSCPGKFILRDRIFYVPPRKG